MEIIAILLALILATLLFGRDAVLGCSVLLIGLAALAAVVGLAVILGVSAIETDTGRAVWRVVKEGAPVAAGGATLVAVVALVAYGAVRGLSSLMRELDGERHKERGAASRIGRGGLIAAGLPVFMARVEKRKILKILEERERRKSVGGPVSDAARIIGKAVGGKIVWFYGVLLVGVALGGTIIFSPWETRRNTLSNLRRSRSGAGRV